MRWRRPWVAMLLVFVLVSPAKATSSERLPRAWMVNAGYFDRAIRDGSPRIASMFLDPPGMIVGAYQLHDGAPFRYMAMSWGGYSVFAAAARWSPPIHTAMYDSEDWPSTPPVERRDPPLYFSRFASLARSHGWRVLIAPHPNLTLVADAPCAARDGESEYDAFLRCDLAGAAARSADILDIQAQGLEEDVPEYRAFVLAAATQARDANPAVRVIAELTTGQAATADEMYAAWASVREVVDGYYLSIGGHERVPVALAFLGMVEERRTG